MHADIGALAVGVGQEKVRTFVDGLESQSAAALGEWKREAAAALV